MSTQQQWTFKVGDGATPTEVFTALEGLYQVPDFSPFNRSTRDATTIDVAAAQATKKMVFNRQREGVQLSLQMDYLPAATAQARLFTQEGNDDGVNIEFAYAGDGKTLTWSFVVLVVSKTVQMAASNDVAAVDQVTVNLHVNSDVTEVAV